MVSSVDLEVCMCIHVIDERMPASTPQCIMTIYYGGAIVKTEINSDSVSFQVDQTTQSWGWL